jgi:hypothetical protein
MTSAGGHAGVTPTKKSAILEIARALKTNRFTPAEIEQIRRQLFARFSADAQTSADYIISILEEAGLRVVRSKQADTQGRYEEEFHDLLHFSTLEDAEMCIIRLDELLRQFHANSEPAAEERILEVGRLGRRRAEMIAHNHKVEPAKRAEKQEIATWFTVWLETPSAFFDWLEVRKKSPDFLGRFGAGAPAAE